MLNAAQIAEYQATGFLTMRAMLEPALLQRLNAAIARICAEAADLTAKTAHIDLDAFHSLERPRIRRISSLGDRFYGTITAYVPGKQAAHYDFTSALPVQLLKAMAPKFHLMLDAVATASESRGSDLTSMKAGSSGCNGAIGG